MRVCDLVVKQRGPLRGAKGAKEKRVRIKAAPLSTVLVDVDGTAFYRGGHALLRATELDNFREVPDA